MQSRVRLAVIVFGVLPALLLVEGCTSPDPLPHVSGSITLKRKGIPLPVAKGKAAGKKVEYVGGPVEGAKVSFMQGGEEVGFGITDAAGRYRVKSLVEGEDQFIDGIPPGAYQVKVTRIRLVANPESVGKDAPPATSGPNPSLPAKYADPETSGFTVLVVEPPAEPDPTLPPPNFFPFLLEE